MFGLLPASKPEKAGSNPAALKIKFASQKGRFAGPAKVSRLIKFPNKIHPNKRKDSFMAAFTV
jgi:hypothetical protein